MPTQLVSGGGAIAPLPQVLSIPAKLDETTASATPSVPARLEEVMALADLEAEPVETTFTNYDVIDSRDDVYYTGNDGRTKGSRLDARRPSVAPPMSR